MPFRSIPAGTTDLETSAARNDREIEIPENRTRRIDYRPDDPVWNGLAIGAGVGAAAAGALVVAACGASNCSSDAADEIAVTVVTFTAIGLGIGAGIDALRRPEHQLVYLAPGSTVSPFTFAVSPLLSKGQKGLLFTIRW